MATPTTNTVGYTNVGAPGPGGGVMSGYKWGGGLGTGVTLTYSFPSAPVAYFQNGYSEANGAGWFPLTAVERGVIVAALNLWSSYANIRFAQTVDTQTTVGELRFAYTNTVGNTEAGHAYYPGGTPKAGDVWFSPSVFNLDRAAMPRGGYDWNTVLHEIGHAIGLEHPFEGQTQLPRSLDNYLYSIMSYTASPWSVFKDNYASFYPTTPMYYDLLALQQMYGKNLTANGGNSVYTFVDGARYWQAINDASGFDTITYTGVESSSIDLRAGTFSALSETIFFTSASTRKTVTIGPGVVKAIRPHTKLPLDVHLMIQPVDHFIEGFAKAGADIITVHAEATTHLERTLHLIKSFGVKCGVSIVPSTSEESLKYIMNLADLILVMTVNPGFGGQSFIPSQLPKIAAIRKMITTTGRTIDLEVDGGINSETARQAVEAGANVLVAGSAVFTGNAGEYAGNIQALRKPR